METLASLWARDPGDLREKRHELSPAWESACVFNGSPPAGLMWTEQLSPQLQRNKQLQDTLLQREEELARLQEENNKLREFLNSSFVRSLEEKAKKLGADGRRRLKRDLTLLHHGESFPVSKRVCRNLTAEFCSESSDSSACSEPNLDLWVLRTLGLKDRDTIDTSDQSEYSALVYDITSSPEGPLASSLSPPLATSTPTSVHGYCQTQESDCPARSADDCGPSPGDVTATTRLYPDTAIRTFNQSAPFLSNCTSSLFQTPVYWSSLHDNQTSLQDNQISPVSTSSPVSNLPWTPVSGCSPTSPAMPQTPRNRTDVAFSMSLNPSSTVKTHSFPQGQAFVRRDTEGRWNFTWMPRQGP
ncbi:geminin coiled-coil domain-containing protein 1-like [Parambassis ranga]|uniref:Geminin coiled-coil domain-containing protein 1-like n=1 Tax=Parambassis ranga TaxID=210632 RepID=A0A6P7JG89_9TELE|nr:geminin coiled-coil domain-containing protein 1-like [Parambassis ranga]XP_028275944.1 geminin coiled-coil domain-containing protein 1-like [Parambassis ranga]